ncbi:MAG: S9 family peptidase [Proteobacteria bacterium]|nr:S9 family peptidase [Pseudomonadota bacterium]
MSDPDRNSPAEPRAELRPVQSYWHGTTLSDDFAWLKAANWREVMRDPALLSPEIRAYLEAENAYADLVMADTRAFQERLFGELKGRIKEDDSTVPQPDGAYAYFMRYREGGQHPIVCRLRPAQDEEIMLDGDLLAQGKAFFDLGPACHSPDHRLLAWTCDEAGSEFYTARVRDLAGRADLADVVPDVSGSVVWTSDSGAFFYVRLDQQHRPSQVLLHHLGTPASADRLVHACDDPGFFVSLSRVQTGHFAEISNHDHTTSESWLLDLKDPAKAPMPVAACEKDVRYDVEHHPSLNGRQALLFLTNADGAEDFKIAWTPLETPGRRHWRDLVAHRSGVYILSIVLFHDWLVRLEREDGLPRIVARRLASGEEHQISFPEDAYSLGVDAGFEFATDRLRFSYSSMTTPTEVWDYDLGGRVRQLRKRQEIPSGHDPSAYVTRRLHARAADGEAIPISLLHHKDVRPDGCAPGMIYGYGAYGIAIPAGFVPNRLSLVDRGFVYAIAHVRGGTEKGWRWYREGKVSKKSNTFNDFIAVTEFLVEEKWIHPAKVIAHGGSAGGMLMGVVANSRPDLFAGMVAEVPFVDVLHTMLDDSLPLTPPEWPEWGNPIVEAEAFAAIRAFSPYDNVRAQDYPAILALAGLIDPRVTYWEPAKWIAKLRRLRTNRKLLVFRTNLEAGHAGAAGRFDRLREIALAYAFAIKIAGGSLAG